MGRRSIYRRFGPAIRLAAAALVPPIALGVQRGIASNANDLRDWLPAHYPETRRYRWFRGRCDSRDSIVASWPGCTLDDPRLDRFAEHLAAADGREPGGPRFGRVQTGRTLLRLLTRPPVSLDAAAAVERLRGVVVGPDGRLTCAVVLIGHDAGSRLDPALRRIRGAARAAGVPGGEVRLGGIPVINHAPNQESTRSLVRLACLSGILGLVIAWFCFRDLRLTAPVLVVGVYSTALGLAIVPATGTPLNAIAITMVPLIYVTAVSGAIHLTNYYLDSLEAGETAFAPDRAVRQAALPLSLAAVTTMLGLLSLGYSDLKPIRMFGVSSGIGVGIGSASQFLPLPAAFALLAPPRVLRRSTAYDTCGRAIIQSRGIIGIALSAFALSSFVPTFRFGLLMFLLLTAGLLANLLFLPALLSGVLGGRIVAAQRARLAAPPVNP